MFGPSNDDIPASELRLAASLARQADIIQRRNARFAAMTPERKRMTLARDVIKWLIGGKLKPAGDERTGGSMYLNVYDAQQLRISDEVLRTSGVNGFNCTACAVGGLIAAASYRNVCQLYNEAGDYLPVGPGNDPTAVTLGKELEKAGFSVPQVLLIEQAYELGAGIPDPSKEYDSGFGTFPDGPRCTEQEVKAARAFGAKHKDRQDRMMAIMQNIIDNNGTFVP